jgi:uroporphyrin-III C-methyltransferase
VTGRVLLVGAGAGMPDLITLRGWRALTQADVVLYDSLVDEALLEDLTAARIFVGKRCARPSMSQEEINERMVALARAGKVVVRLKGGDPTVFGRGGEEAAYLASRQIPFEFVPGVSNAIAAPAFAGIPLTYRGIADGFTVVTAHRQRSVVDFCIPPYSSRRTLVLLMGVATMPAWREQLLALAYPAVLPLALVCAGGTRQQRVIVTTIDHCVEESHTGRASTPATAVVGRVVELREKLRWFAHDAAEVEAPAAPALHRREAAR